MQNEARTNAILAVIVLILALLAWFKPGLQQHTLQYLSSIAPDAIETIIIERDGMDSIRLSKHQQHWMLQSPYTLAANPLRVKTILALADKRSYAQFEVTENELKRYGLDQPKLRVWLNDKRFDLGGKAPLNGQRYAINVQENIHNNAGQTRVHLINGTVYYQLRAPVDSFISPALIPPGAEITQIKWADNLLSLNNNGQWQLQTTAENAGTQTDSVAQLIQYWQTTQASRVETDMKKLPSSDLQKQLTQKTITLHIKHNGQKQTIAYTIIQEDRQIKLLRRDLNIAWWITPQQLKLLTEFLPVAKAPETVQ